MRPEERVTDAGRVGAAGGAADWLADPEAGGDSVEMKSGSALVVVVGRAEVSMAGGGGLQADKAMQRPAPESPRSQGIATVRRAMALV